MKTKFIIVAIALILQGCSWIVRFFVVNETKVPITIEMTLQKNVSSFPIFHYGPLYTYKAEKNKVDCEQPTEANPVYVGDDKSHYKVELPTNAALEIGRLENDKYEKYDQMYINGRVFNIESLKITSGGKETVIVPKNFDNYFKKGGDNEIFYYVK